MDNQLYKWLTVGALFFFALCSLLVALNIWAAQSNLLLILAGIFLVVALVFVTLNQRWRHSHPKH
ncbi:hypothetical protein [Levilactobacillus namurensis]|uniref:hypothetical protein n=1 Tax=Levilactobacillus namurensis TaxID=380393 RepID=UPI000466B1C7|nr:hypothetical protein [Levilactobacillus namurensis]MCW3779155.1 hypothetical protein [Levilactobacillus namurensis]MDT7017716.1 hypothetical protein [Levilactobacillus namurensis]WNN65282.1 hypothetical protein RIN67_11425 [Levilactobacillus namurensis]